MWKKKKKNVTTVATVPPDTVATVQNLKKKKDKVAQQNGTVNVQHKNTECKVQKYHTPIHTFIYQKKEHKSMIEKKKYILNKPKVP